MMIKPEIDVKEEMFPFYGCPNCKHEHYSIAGTDLENCIKDAVYHEDWSCGMECTRQAQTALDSMFRAGLISKKINIVDIKISEPDFTGKKLAEFDFGDKKVNEELLKLLGNTIWVCYDCNTGYSSIDEFDTIERPTKYYVCDCGTKIHFVADNKTSKGDLLCPYCLKSSHPTICFLDAWRSKSAKYHKYSNFIDHVRYDDERDLLVLQPYTIEWRDLQNLISEADDSGFTVDMYGRNEHYKDCFSIVVKRIDN